MRVAAITPMFSAYVVVPAPPNAPATVVPTPSPMKARPRSLSRSAPVISDDGLDVTGVLGDQHDHDGQEQQHRGEREAAAR